MTMVKKNLKKKKKKMDYKDTKRRADEDISEESTVDAASRQRESLLAGFIRCVDTSAKWRLPVWMKISQTFASGFR